MFSWSVGPTRAEHADSPHALGLLCARRSRLRRCRATEQRDEIASPPVDHAGFLPFRLAPLA
jgi:hypothetical protein